MMAISNVTEEQIDILTGTTSQTLAEPTPDADVALDTLATEQDITPEMITPVEEPGPIQLAGMGDAITGVVKSVAGRVKKAEEKVLPPFPDKPIHEIGGQVIIRPATEDEMKTVDLLTGGKYKKGINFPRIAESLGEFEMADYMARLKDANKDLFEQARRGTFNFNDMLKAAEEQGIDNILTEWLTRNAGQTAKPEELVGGMLAIVQITKETDELAVAAGKLPAGPERDAAMNRFYQMGTIRANLYANVSGASSEAGRSLYAIRAFGEMTGENYAATASELGSLFGADGPQDFEYIHTMYMALPKPGRAKFLQQGIMSKTMDVITEVWINSILSHPTTHMVNIAGNSMFMMTRVAETYLAAVIGRGRSAITGNTERVQAREGFVQLDAIRTSIADAFVVAGKTLLTEEASDLASKIDVRQRRAIGDSGDPRVIYDQISSGNIAAGTLNIIGSQLRMGGRLLLTEDEFFKGIGYRMALSQEAAERGANMFDQTLAAGKTLDEAKAAGAAEEARILTNPPEIVVQNSKDAARQMTFQSDLGGFLGDMQGAMSHPLLKLFVPFYKTPTNVMKETLKRTPLSLAFPSTREALKAGGRAADKEMAKIALGSSVMGMFAYSAMGLDTPDNDVMILGSGPSDFKAKQAMARQGLQPFSINFKNRDEAGKWDGTYTSYTYSRFDPVSGLLAMAADFAYYSQYEDDVGVLENLAAASALGIAQYSMQLPFLQGVEEMASIFRGGKDPKAILTKMQEMAGQKLTEAGLSLAPTVSSFTAGLTRIDDPTARSTLLPKEGMFGEDPTQVPAFMRGFYTALQKAKARNPFFNDTLPPKLNLWGEPMMVGSGSGWEFVNPVRIQESKYSPVDEELQSLGGGITMPDKKPDGVLLNADQYNKFILYQSKMDADGNMPGDDGYDISTTLLPSLEAMIGTNYYKETFSKEDKLTMIVNRVSMFRQRAKMQLKLSDEDFAIKAAALQ